MNSIFVQQATGRNGQGQATGLALRYYAKINSLAQPERGSNQEVPMDIDNTRSAASSDDMNADTSSESDAMDIDAPPSSPGRVDRIKLAWYCDANKRLNDENVQLMAKVADMEKAAKEKSDKLQGRFDELKRVVVNAFNNIERKNARLQAQVTALEAKAIRLERESRAMKVLLARCMHAECLPPYPGPPALPQGTAAAPPSSNPPAYRS